LPEETTRIEVPAPGADSNVIVSPEEVYSIGTMYVTCNTYPDLIGAEVVRVCPLTL
jgi:hypothetical protein